MNRIAAAALAAALLAPAPAAARPPGPHARGGPPLHVIAERVGLSPSQVARIRKLTFSLKRRLIPLHAKLAEAKLDLQEAMSADTPPSDAKARKLVERIGRLHTQIRVERVLGMLRIRRTMSAAQWRKLEALKRRFGKGRPMHGKKRWRKGMGRPGGGGPPGGFPPLAGDPLD